MSPGRSLFLFRLFAGVLIAFAFLAICALEHVYAGPCVYRDRFGRVHQAQGRDFVPVGYRAFASCDDRNTARSAARGSMRGRLAPQPRLQSSSADSLIGEVYLEIDGTIRDYFRLNPKQLVNTATRAVNNALEQTRLSSELDLSGDPLQIVVIKDTASKDLPPQVRNTCHSGWYDNKDKIYLVAKNLAYQCSSIKRSRMETDQLMLDILVHEIGHAVEHRLMAGKSFNGDRVRAEGFATWFQSIAGSYLPAGMRLPEGTFISRAKTHMKRGSHSSFRRSGDVFDYARAAAYFAVLSDSFGYDVIPSIYEEMRVSKLSFFNSVHSYTGWSRARLEEEVGRYLSSRSKG